MPLIVTRPQPQAALWVQALQQAGVDAVACPLIEIASPDDRQALPRAHQALQTVQAVMCVSAQAVHYLLQGQKIPAHTRFWAPGPGTAKALLDAGVSPGQIDSPPPTATEFDSEALWPVVAPQVQPGVRLLWARGQSANGSMGRDWLIRQCEAAGAQVHSVAVYQRRAPQWTSAQCTQVARWIGQGACWLFSSSESLQHLQQLCPQQDWCGAHAMVTHPRIQETAQSMQFGEIIKVRPALSDVLEACRAHGFYTLPT
jgi:uroporphyrinogen-III synthase